MWRNKSEKLFARREVIKQSMKKSKNNFCTFDLLDSVVYNKGTTIALLGKRGKNEEERAKQIDRSAVYQAQR